MFHGVIQQITLAQFFLILYRRRKARCSSPRPDCLLWWSTKALQYEASGPDFGSNWLHPGHFGQESPNPGNHVI